MCGCTRGRRGSTPAEPESPAGGPAASPVVAGAALHVTVVGGAAERRVVVDVDLCLPQVDLGAADVLALALDVAQQPPVAVAVVLARVADQGDGRSDGGQLAHALAGVLATALRAAVHLGRVDADD